MNCDVLTDLNPQEIPPGPALVAVHPRSPWGILVANGTMLEEKPLLDIWVSAGIYRLPVSIRSELADEGMLPELAIPRLLREGRMRVHYHKGFWTAIETLKDADAYTYGR